MSRLKWWFVVPFTIAVAVNISSAFARRATAAFCTLPINRVQQTDLTYVGAFRLPVIDYRVWGVDFNAGAEAMGFNPQRNSLFVSVDEGPKQYNSYLAEVTIPVPLKGVQCVRNGGGGCVGSELNEAGLLQGPTEAYGGLFGACANGSSSGCRPRGVLATSAGDLFLSAYINYDATYVGNRALYKRSTSLANPAASGPFEINGFGAGSAWNGGVCGGFQMPIPVAWQGTLGGDTACANWDLSINSRVSWGPSFLVYNRADVGVQNPVRAAPLLFYNADHPTLGTPIQQNAQWNDAGPPGGAIFVDGTSTVLFFTEHTDHPCYGVGTTDPTLQGTPTGTGDIYCLDYEVTSKGQHGNPWTQRVWAYDANDLAAVKAGSKQPWAVVPYAWWDFEFPQFQYTHLIKSAAYDPSTQRIYLAGQYGDVASTYYNAPVIHAYQVTIH
jgi:hypothetical protein